MTKLFALNRKQTLGSLALAVTLTAGITIAAAAPNSPAHKPGAPTDCGPGHRGHDPFARWDKDNDGKITLKELPAKPQARLTSFDTNKDGTLTREEFEKEIGQKRRSHFAERFAADDKNKDGYLVQTEIPERWEHLKAADTNNDGKLTLAELQTAFESGKLGRPGDGPGREHRKGPPPQR